MGFSPLGTAIIALQRGGFPMFATTKIVLLILFIQHKVRLLKEEGRP